MITIEELCSDNQKLVDENLKLRKENAKLKETVACLREDIDVKRKDIDWYKKRGAELDSMLTDKIRDVKKAKEIIKELLDFDFLPENEIKKQAEQFLREEKKC